MIPQRRKVVWMFSGQGSQYRNMGRDLYEADPVFRETLDRSARIVRPWIGVSLVDELYSADRAGALDDTHLTHPAICAVQYALARALQARGHRPDLLVGYSLGEIVAQLVSEVFPLETGLELLHRHANLMETATSPGGMLAVLDSPAKIQPLLHFSPGLWLAAHNFERHCVVSGRPEALDALQSRLESEQTTVQRLPVRRAFHSPLMDEAEPGFLAHLGTLRPRPPRCPIISAATGETVCGLSGLWTATRARVNFLRTIRGLEEAHGDGLIYLDLGPSGTLATFLRYIGVAPRSAFFPVVTPWGGALKNIQNYENALAARA